MVSILSRYVRRLSVIVLTLVSAVCVVPRVAVADPITVTGGSMGIWSDGGDLPDNPVPLLEFLFGFPVRIGNVEYMSGEAYPTSPAHGSIGGLVVDRAPLPDPLIAGASVNLSTHVSWTNGGLSEQVNVGCCFESVMYRTAGAFSFVAGDAVLLPQGDQLVGSAPFTFTATIAAFDPTGGSLFTRSLQGQGRARLITYPAGFFDAHNPDRAAYGDFFVYIYEAEPVPEPATLMLLAASLGVLGFRARRRPSR